MNPDLYLEEPEPTNYEQLEDERDTRAADDADAARKEES